jgi:hypothetical protein
LRLVELRQHLLSTLLSLAAVVVRRFPQVVAQEECVLAL